MHRLKTYFLAILLVMMAPVHAIAAELIMFDESGCPWCERWEEEIGVIYDKTAEGKRAPLRRLDVHDPLPEDLELASRPHFTPTFILVDNGREIDRIEGYPGEDFFWGLLAIMLKALPEPGHNDVLN